MVSGITCSVLTTRSCMPWDILPMGYTSTMVYPMAAPTVFFVIMGYEMECALGHPILDYGVKCVRELRMKQIVPP